MYQFSRKFLFLFSAETAHKIAMQAMRMACALPPLRGLLKNLYSPGHSKPVNLWGLRFLHPVGLAAGFDKNASYLRELEVLGFAFVEIGTVTPRPQDGNPKPRLFRLPTDQALINRMGFNNDGVDVIAKRLKKWKQGTGRGSNLLVGGNIGKNKLTPNEEAWKDYLICFRALHPFVDFFVVNVSSPNTPGLRALQEKEALREILVRLQEANTNFERPRPILLKLAPDLGTEQINEVIELAREIRLDGIVAANTTISRDQLKSSAKELERIGAGGLSGRPLRERANEMMQYLSAQTGGAVPLIGSGGIFNGADAVDRMQAGANLVEVWTGFIYEGPRIVKQINKALNTQ